MRPKKIKKIGFSVWRAIFILIAIIFFYIWLQGITINLGYQIYQAETKYKELLAENRQLKAQILSLKSVSAIRSRLSEFKIPMVEPKTWNIYYLKMEEKKK